MNHLLCPKTLGQELQVDEWTLTAPWKRKAPDHVYCVTGLLSTCQNMDHDFSKLVFKYAFQPKLSFTTEKGTFASKVCLWENGGWWFTDHMNRGKKAKLLKHEVWKISFPLPLEEKESIQGSEIVKCYFSTSFLEAQGNQRSHGYSSLVTILFQNWGLFRCCVSFSSPGILCSLLHESYHVYGLDEIVKSFFFFTVPLHISSLTTIAYPGSMQSGYRVLLDVLICFRVNKPSIPPLPYSSFYHIFRYIAKLYIDMQHVIPITWATVLSFACIFTSLANSEVKYDMLLSNSVKLWHMKCSVRAARSLICCDK